jgi:hypothetical protein
MIYNFHPQGSVYNTITDKIVNMCTKANRKLLVNYTYEYDCIMVFYTELVVL